MAGIYSLSAELLQQVLYFVPLKERLRSSLVSSSFSAAAAAATTKLDIWLRKQQQLDSLQTYIAKHGSHLTSLFTRRWSTRQLQFARLPCKNLQALRLDNCAMQLDRQSGSDQQGLLHGCTALTRLELRFCTISGDFRTALTPLSALTNLQHLVLQDLCTAHVPVSVPTGLLGHFSQLTYLDLNFHAELGGAVDWGVLPLLREVRISAPNLAEADLAGLQKLQHLSSLQVMADGSIFCADFVPESLQLLELTDVQLQPGPMRSLAYLRLGEVQLPDAAALLAMMAQLQQLTHLSVTELQCQWPAGSPAYTALTASSKLQDFILHSCAPPVGVWQHVFAPTKRLPDLWRASLWWYGIDGEAIPPTPAGLQFSSSDVQLLATCCPGLMDVTIAVQPDADLSPLSKLTALTELNVEGASQQGVAGLAAVTSLQELQLHSSPASLVEEQWLLPLTALRQMTWLSCRPYAYRYPDGSKDDDGLEIRFDGAEGDSSAPEVWLDLLQHLAEQVDNTVPSIARGLGQQLAQAQDQVRCQQQQLAQQSAQLSQQSAQLAQQSAQLAQQGARVAQLEQQLAQQQAVQSELQRQMQQLLTR